LRYWRWGGDGEAFQPEKMLRRGNCLKTTQIPNRQVHALSSSLEYIFNYIL
jgi:hypothetical protein